jgi:3-oxoadipate enol-lactonase/3-oxoadipate enol-lactonase/4-carboxymuconolactone decarboxylase
MAAKYVQVDGHAINYIHSGRTTLPGVVPDLGQGHLLLFLHAAGGTANLWRRQIDHFGAAHSAMALDLPGHGRSSGVEGLASIADYAACVATFAERLGLRPFVAVGRSMGSAIALALALHHPARVRGLVLACAAARFEFPAERLDTLRDVVRGRLPQQFTTETFSPTTGFGVMKEVWTEQVQTDPRVRYTDLLACAAFDARDRLGEIRVPALVVAGADDHVTPVAASEELAAKIPRARLVVIPDAGHQAPLEQPEAFNRAVAEFLETLR